MIPPLISLVTHATVPVAGPSGRSDAAVTQENQMDFVDVVMKRRAVRRFEEGGVDRTSSSASPDSPSGRRRRVQPGPTADRRDGPGPPREVARICGEDEYEPTSGRGSASARRSSSPASARRSTTVATRSRTRSTEDGSEIEWPVPFWWIDVGATMQNIMLAAVNEGLGCGFVGRTSTRCARTSASRGVHPDRRHARGPTPARCPVTEPQARLGRVR